VDTHGWIALATLVAATVMFVGAWLPLAATALLVPVVLAVTRTISPEAALAGFGNHAAISIGATFVVGAGMKESGVATLLARGLEHVGGRRETALLTLLLVATASLSAWMSNAATVAMLLPVAVAVARRAMIEPSRLLMPMSHAAVWGGTITVMGTQPNFLVAEYAASKPALGGVGFFDFAPVGLAVFGLGLVTTLVISRRLLPERSQQDRLREAKLPEEVAASYGLAENLFLMRVAPSSPLAGTTIAQAGVRSRYGLGVVMVRRQGPWGGRWLDPKPHLVLEAGDVLYVEGADESAWQFAEEQLCQLGLAGPQTIENLLGRGITLVEVTVAPHGDAIGRPFRELDLGKRYGVNVLSLWRGSERLPTVGADTKFEVGDTFLISGTGDQVRALARDPDYIVLSDASQVEDLSRAPRALLGFLIAVVPPIVGFLPIAASALTAALFMVLTGCISRAALTRCVDWKVLALIVGTLPLGTALEQTGVAAQAASLIDSFAADLGKPGVLTALFLLSAVLGVLTSNAAAAVVVAPVAARAAELAGFSPHTALLMTAYGASCTYLLPFAQQNILVMAPGGYTTKDFVRVGTPMSLVMLVACVALLSWMG
jgi:di/tricarboxylate transporter